MTPPVPAASTESIAADPDPDLTQALDRLVSRAVLTPDQASAVLAEVSLSATAAPAAPGRAPLSGRLAEVAAYAGAVLVGAAAMLLVAQQWDQLGRPGRAIVLGAVTVVLAAAGLVAALAQPRGRTTLRLPAHAVRRRFASTALSLAAAAAAGTVAVLVTDHELLAFAISGVVTAAVAVVLAPSAVSEVTALGALGLLAGAVIGETEASMTVGVLVFAALGVAWLAVSRAEVLAEPTLGLALGLTMTVTAGGVGAFFDAQPAEAVGLLVLALVTLVGLAAYVRAPQWPLAAAGVGALALVVLRLSNDTLGPVVGVLLTGLVLLGGSGLVLLRRRSAG